ncbi:MAG: hypothetical protein GTO40_05860, partial [Deltaproteobacteria bacterium]|nr:hypothetical protein [Deltaproteobacteria bacterium]
DTRIEATRKHFDLQAKEYDLEHRARPHYSEMQQVVARAIPFSFEASFSVLELGVGTALLTEKILQRFPSVKLDGLELSPEMITQAGA